MLEFLRSLPGVTGAEWAEREIFEVEALLRLVAEVGVPPLTTGRQPRLSLAEEATLAAWPARTASLTGRLRDPWRKAAVTGSQPA